jgi:hypothetical protein
MKIWTQPIDSFGHQPHCYRYPPSHPPPVNVPFMLHSFMFILLTHPEAVDPSQQTLSSNTSVGEQFTPKEGLKNQRGAREAQEERS